MMVMIISITINDNIMKIMSQAQHLYPPLYLYVHKALISKMPYADLVRITFLYIIINKFRRECIQQNYAILYIINNNNKCD